VIQPAERLPGAEPSRHASPAAKPPFCLIVQNQSFGGMEVHTIGLMQALIDAGHSLELISNRYRAYDEVIRQRGWEANVRVIHTHLEGILYGTKGNRREWLEVFRGLRSRVLIFPRGDCNYGQLGFLKACSQSFDKVYFIEHLEARPRPASVQRWAGVVPGLQLWWHKRRILSRLGSAYADRIIAVSGSVRRRLVNEFGYDPAKVVVVHNGVAWRKLLREEARGVAFRARYGIPPGSFVFGMLIRLEPQKGVDVALHALAQLLARNPHADPYLVIAGEGRQLEELTRLSESLGLSGRVKFIGFVREPDEVLSGYDVILFSSRNEGLPLGLLEGMAAGCVPIVTRVSGMPEAVSSPELGCVVAPENPAELSRAMERILVLDAASLARMRERVVQNVRDHFDIDDCHRKILEVCGLEVCRGPHPVRTVE